MIDDDFVLLFSRNNMNKKPYEFDEHLVRSGARIRESVRCLPRGHFQQIRQMFDRSTPSHQLPITDDEKFQHETKISIDQSIHSPSNIPVEKKNLEETFFVFEEENKGNQMIECQRPVLSRLINHPKSKVK